MRRTGTIGIASQDFTPFGRAARDLGRLGRPAGHRLGGLALSHDRASRPAFRRKRAADNIRCHAGPAKSHIAPFALYAPSDASGRPPSRRTRSSRTPTSSAGPPSPAWKPEMNSRSTVARGVVSHVFKPERPLGGAPHERGGVGRVALRVELHLEGGHDVEAHVESARSARTGRARATTKCSARLGASARQDVVSRCSIQRLARAARQFGLSRPARSSHTPRGSLLTAERAQRRRGPPQKVGAAAAGLKAGLRAGGRRGGRVSAPRRQAEAEPPTRTTMTRSRWSLDVEESSPTRCAFAISRACELDCGDVLAAVNGKVLHGRRPAIRA